MEKSLDFKVIFYMLRTKIVWIVVSAMIGALAAFAISSFLLTEMFTAETQVYVSNTQELQDSKVQSSDLSASRSMANTYCIILESPRAKDLLNYKLSQDEAFTSSKVQEYQLRFSVVDNTEVLKIEVRSADPKLSALVCNTMVDVAIDMINEIFDSGRCNPLGESIPNYVPSSPDIRSNMLIGLVLGVVLSGALIIVWFMLDNRVKDENDFVQKVGIPVLGEIPSMHPNVVKRRTKKGSKKKGYGYYYAYTKQSDNR